MIKDLPKSLIESAKQVLEKKMPFADISHHKTKDHLIEGDITTWLNHKQPYDHQFNDFVMHGAWINGINSKAYEMEDPQLEMADEHIANLDRDHHYAVDAYVTGSLEGDAQTGSEKVNKHLILRHKQGKEPDQEFTFGDDPDYAKTLNLKHLDAAIDRNKLEKTLTTYSGIGFNPRDLLQDNGLLHLPAYTSSSVSRAVSLMYAKPDDNGDRHILQITHPKGSTGLYIGDNEDLTPFRQKEHISPRNMTLKISKEPETHTDNYGQLVHIWKATRK